MLTILTFVRLMDARTRQVIVVIYNHKIVYADKKMANVVDVMSGLETDFVTRQTLSEKLKRYGFYSFTSESGRVYQFYFYENPNYKSQTIKSNNA